MGEVRGTYDHVKYCNAREYLKNTIRREVAGREKISCNSKACTAGVMTHNPLLLPTFFQ